jgi:hypothetical protein
MDKIGKYRKICRKSQVLTENTVKYTEKATFLRTDSVGFIGHRHYYAKEHITNGELIYKNIVGFLLIYYTTIFYCIFFVNILFFIFFILQKYTIAKK